MVQYAQQDMLSSLCSAQNENLGTLLVEVVASVLDNEVFIFSFFFHFYRLYYFCVPKACQFLVNHLFLGII